jgi:hypothetical protein
MEEVPIGVEGFLVFEIVLSYETVEPLSRLVVTASGLFGLSTDLFMSIKNVTYIPCVSL